VIGFRWVARKFGGWANYSVSTMTALQGWHKRLLGRPRGLVELLLKRRVGSSQFL
jgi:hypothetical protein